MVQKRKKILKSQRNFYGTWPRLRQMANKQLDVPVTIRQPANSYDILHAWKHIDQLTFNYIADLQYPQSQPTSHTINPFCTHCTT